MIRNIYETGGYDVARLSVAGSVAEDAFDS
jgi:hypothetical protein